VSYKTFEGWSTYRGQRFARQGNSEDGSVIYFTTIGECREEYRDFSLPAGSKVVVMAFRKYEGQELWQMTQKGRIS